MATKSDAKTITYQPGEVLFEEGAAAHNVFIINDGHVEIRKRVFKEEVVIETLGRGNVCGDIAFADGATYPATARAIQEVEAVVVHRDELQTVMLSNPKVVQRLVARMAARITHAHFRIANASLQDLTGRLLLQLRAEAERAGAMEGDVFVTLPYDLPDMLAAERGRVDQALASLVKDRLIESDGAGRFRIPDVAAFDRRLTYIELRDRIEG